MGKSRIPKLLLLSSLVLGAQSLTPSIANLEAEVQNTSQNKTSFVLMDFEARLNDLKYMQNSAIDELTDYAVSTYKYDNSYIRGRKSKIRTIDNQIEELGTYLGAQELGEAIGTIIGLAYLLGSEESKKKTDEWIEGHESRHRYEPREMSSDEKKEAIKELNHHKKILEMSVNEEVEHLKERKRYEIRGKIEKSTEKFALTSGGRFSEDILRSCIPMEKSLWCKPLTYVVLYSELIIRNGDKNVNFLNYCVNNDVGNVGVQDMNNLRASVETIGEMQEAIVKAADNKCFPTIKMSLKEIKMTSSGNVSAESYESFKNTISMGKLFTTVEYLWDVMY